MNAVSLQGWLRDVASHDALLAAWRDAPEGPLADHELDALALAALAGQRGIEASIGQPSGRSRLPLFAAVHAAALQLPGYPSPFAPRRTGPIVLASRQVVRREEVQQLDVAGVRLSPALNAARLRADGRAAPLAGGRPRTIGPENRLIFVRDFAAATQLSPATIIVDAADEDDGDLSLAVEWARAQNALCVVFEDSARRRWRPGSVIHAAGWAAINADSLSDASPLRRIAPRRGHATVIDAGSQPDLAFVAVLLADARRHGQFPGMLIEAATLWRRLDELVVPLAEYDAACPRWHTRTLSERLEDLTSVRSSSFPRGWGLWAEMSWGAVKHGLASAHRALADRNMKAELMVALLDDELRGGRDVDFALPSRVARDASLRYLGQAGVYLPVDGRLIVRSLRDVGPSCPPRATLLVGPPTRGLRHRVTASDIGSLNVLCYAHEVRSLRSALVANLDEPREPSGPLADLLPSGLRPTIDLPACPPEVVLTTVVGESSVGRTHSHRLVDLADQIDAAGIAALSAFGAGDLDELPGDEGGVEASETRDGSKAGAPRAVVTLTVATIGNDMTQVIRVPVQRSVLHLLAGRAERIPVIDVRPSMLVADLDGPSPFDRLRPLLIDARGPATRMLLAAWDQAVEMAMLQFDGPSGLSTALQGNGSTIQVDAVRAWTDADRIGPRDPADVTRVGDLAGHPVVAANGAAIAEVMRALRVLHQAVGRALGGALSPTADAVDDLEQLLGTDAVSLINEIVVFRVLAVGRVTLTTTPLAHAEALAEYTLALEIDS